VKVLVAQSCPTLCDLMYCDPMYCSLPDSSVHGTLQARTLEWIASHSFLQGIFPIQGLNLGLPHCRQILYHLSHQGSPFNITKTVSRKLVCITLLVWSLHFSGQGKDCVSVKINLTSFSQFSKIINCLLETLDLNQ